MLTLLKDFPRITQAVVAYQQGLPVLLLDDDDRENEADIIAAAENISIETMALMIREGSGIVCLCLDEEIADELALSPMVADNQSRFQTAFTVSIEAKEGVSTGVSAQDRVTTIQAALFSTSQHMQIVSPGHIFPLRARKGGVLERRGHTEGSVALAKLAGVRAAAVLCELTNPDGTMAKGEEVEAFAKLHKMPMLTIEELAHFFLLQQAVQSNQQVIEAKSLMA